MVALSSSEKKIVESAVKNAEKNEPQIPTNLRLLLILELLAGCSVPMTPTDVNRQLGLPKPTIHRLFATLEAEGFIERDIDGRHYELARRAKRLSMSILSTSRTQIARIAILTQLSERIGETCNIALPDRDGMIYLDRVETKWPLRIQLPVGSKVPFYCTASGKLYLTTLPDRVVKAYVQSTKLEAQTSHSITDPQRLIAELGIIKDRGYATDDEEFMIGMVALAVPVTNQQQQCNATLSIHAPKSRLDLHQATECIDELRSSAEQLARLMWGD